MIGIALQNLEAVFGWILAASWQASILAALVLLLQWVLGARLNPRWRYALWLLVLTRLLLPALPESALSLFQFAPPPPESFVTPVTEPLFVSTPLPAPQVSDLQPVAPTYPFSFYSLLALTWLGGATILFLLTWHVNRRFAQQIADSPEINDLELLRLFVATKAELNIFQRIRLIENGNVQSPAIMGLFRPTLLLPLDARTKFDTAELRFIFLHELAHLKRGDVIAQAVIALLQIVHWFNPILWFAFRRMRIDREPATDALVLSRTGENEKERYGLMLIKLLEHFNQRHSLPTLVGILEDKDQFKRRFSLIAKFTRGAYGWSLLGIFLIGALAVACLTKSKGPAIDDLKNSTTQISGMTEAEAKEKGIAALVNGRPVYWADINYGLGEPHPSLTNNSSGKEPQGDTAFEKTVKALRAGIAVDNELIVQTFKASKANLPGDAQMHVDLEVKRRLDLALKGFGGDKNAFSENLKKNGLSYDRFNEMNRRQEMFAYMDSRVVAGPTEKYVESQYPDSPNDSEETKKRRQDLFTAEDMRRSNEWRQELRSKATIQLFGDAVPKSWMVATVPATSATTSAESAQPDKLYLSTRIVEISEADYQAHQSEIDAATQRGDYEGFLKILPSKILILGQPEFYSESGKINATVLSPVDKRFPEKNLCVSTNFTATTDTDKIAFAGKLAYSSFTSSTPVDKNSSPPKFATFQVDIAQETSLGKTICLPSTGESVSIYPDITTASEALASIPKPKFARVFFFLKVQAAPTTEPTTPVIAASPAPNPTADAQALMIRFATNLIQIGEDDYQAHKGEIDSAVQKGDVKALAALNLKSFNPIGDPFVIDQDGEQAVIEIVRELPYAIAFDKDKNGKMTATDFKKQYLGFRFVARPKISEGKINFTGKMNVTSLQGWTRHKDQTDSPDFRVRELSLSEAFAQDQTKGYEVPGGAQMEPEDPKVIFYPDQANSPWYYQHPNSIAGTKPPTSLSRQFFFVTTTLFANDGTKLAAIPQEVPHAVTTAGVPNMRTSISYPVPAPVPMPPPTPLQVASAKGDYDKVKSLMAQGAEFYITDVGDALMHGRARLVKLFWDHGPHYCSELAYVISQDASVERVQQLLDKGAQTGGFEDRMITPLGVAAQRGNLAVAQLLAKHGANLNPDNEISNPLSLAAQEEKSEMVDFLIQSGAHSFFLPLIHAIGNSMTYPEQKPRESAAKTMAVLIAAGGLKGLSEDNKAFLLIIAADHKNPAILKQLLDAGLSPLSKRTMPPEDAGKSALEIVRGQYARSTTDEPYNKDLKPLLDMLEAVNTGDASTVSKPTVPTTSSPGVTISGKIRVTHPELVDLEKSTGTLVSMGSAINQDYEFNFNPDGSFTLPHVTTGIYSQRIKFARKVPDASAPELVDVTASQLFVDGKTQQLTTNLNLDVPFKGVAKGSIEIELKVAEIPDDVYQANKEKVDAAIKMGGPSIIGLLNSLEGVSLLSAPSVSTRTDQKASIELVREFVYPTAFERPKIVRNISLTGTGANKNLIALAGPTPRDFVTKDVGVTAEITPSLDQGKILLNGKFSVTNFAGFVSSDLGAQMPSFNTSESMFVEALDDRQLKGIWIPGAHIDEQTIGTYRPSNDTKIPSDQPGKKRYLIFLSANLVK